MNVHIFVPCYIDRFFPQTAQNMVTVLQRCGCTVHYHPAQTCCAQPAFNAGFVETAAAVAQKFINDFEDDLNNDPIVCPSASCTGFVRNYFTGLLPNVEAANCVSGRITEFSEFLVNHLKITNVGASFNATATYHHSCSALRECGIKTEPLALLEQVAGLTLLPLPDFEVCCGFGGTFSVKYEPVSVAMAAAKVNAALQHPEVQYLISADMSCLMHLRGYIEAQNIQLQTLHLADVLAMQE